MNSHTHVTGKFLVPVGSEEKPLSGEISFIAKADSIRGDGKIYLPAPVTVQLDESGAFAVDLLVPADSLQPSAWSWEAVPSLSYEGAIVPWCSFFFDPMGKAEVDLSEVAPVPDPVTGEYVTRGEPGPTPELSIGQVSTVPAGQETVTITGPAESPTLDFALPAGRLGWTGDRGPQGIPGPAGPAGPTGPSITSISAEDATFNITMSDGTTHRVPFPAGVLSTPAPFTLRADQAAGIGYASGSLEWVDNADGTGKLTPSSASALSLGATVKIVDAGQAATVQVTGTYPKWTLDFALPQAPIPVAVASIAPDASGKSLEVTMTDGDRAAVVLPQEPVPDTGWWQVSKADFVARGDVDETVAHDFTIAYRRVGTTVQIQAEVLMPTEDSIVLPSFPAGFGEDTVLPYPGWFGWREGTTVVDVADWGLTLSGWTVDESPAPKQVSRMWFSADTFPEASVLVGQRVR